MPPTVVIDPGHGGAAPAGGSSSNNAVGPNGLLEKDVTLDVSRRVAALLSEHANVLLTRSGDENRSLVDRARVARDANAAVFVSLHLNGWHDPALDGSEAWVAEHASAASRALARALVDRVAAVTCAPDRGVREEDLGVLLPERLGPATAATLVELAFLTNPDEAARLARDEYRQALAQAVAAAVTGVLPQNGAVAQALTTSGQQDALAQIDAFRAETAAGAFTPARGDVADRAAALIGDPSLVDQASLNLCGPAAFHRLWIARDPKAFARYLTSLYDTGEADIGTRHVKAGSDLRHQSYDGTAVPAMQAAGDVCPSADWIALSALRDSSNTFLDFEGMPDEDVSGITMPAELAGWLRATGLYADVTDEGNWFFTKGLDHAEGLAPDANTDIALLINAHVLTAAAASGHEKSDEFVLNAFPNHFVVLRSRVTEPSADEVEFDCWTWGADTHVRVPKSVFGANYYGAVIARVTVPVRHVSSFALEAPARVDGIHPSAGDADPLPTWPEMKQDGVLFSLHRATEGTTYRDGKYDDRYADARANRALFGAWHFSRWDDAGPLALADAAAYYERQGDVFVQKVGRLLPGDLPPSLDFESKTFQGAPAGFAGVACREPIERFLDRVETALGRTPMIYTGKTLWTEHIDDPIAKAGGDPQAYARFGDYPLWVIRIYHAYGDRRNWDDRLTKTIDGDLPTPWSDWEIWQYDGNPGGGTESTSRLFPHFAPLAHARTLDVDVSNGSIHRLRGLADLGTPAQYGSDVQVVVSSDEDGQILALQNLGFWQTASITDLSSGRRAAGDVAACDAAGGPYLAYRDRSDDHVYELAPDASTPQGTPTVPTDVTGAAIAVGDPRYVVSGNDRALVYRGFDDHFYVAVTVDGAWQPTLDVHSGAGISDPASGDPALYVSGADLHVVGRVGDAGRLVDATLRGAFRPGSTWDRSPVDLPVQPAATYRPAAYVAGDGVHVVYRALRGHIHVIDPALQDVDISQAAGAPTCAGNPATFVLAGVPHVVYRQPDGLLSDLAADGSGGWTRTLLPCAEAAADPAATVVGDTAYVALRGRDGGLHQAKLAAGAWSCQPIGPTAAN